MKLCLTVTSDYIHLYGHDFRAILDVARQADAAGFYQLDFAEHLLMGDGKSYPFGEYPAPLLEPWPEPVTAMAAAAAVTENIRLTTGILIAALRPPALLAKQMATLDSISRGRVDLGVGTGWQIEEFDACGVPFKSRGKRMDDTLRLCQQLWKGEYVTYRTDDFALNNVVAVPPPVQPGGVPIWFGGNPDQRTADRIAELGVGWIPLFLPEPVLQQGIDLMRRTLEQHGRDPNSLQVRHQLPLVHNADGTLNIEATIAPIPRLAEMGVTVAGIGLGWSVRQRERVGDFLKEFAAAVRAL